MPRAAAPLSVSLATLVVVACAARLEGAEGPPEPAAEGGTEAGSDVSVVDASDGATEAEGGTFCASVTGAAYCEDFDRETDLTKILFAETSNPDPGLQPRLTGDTFQSPPRALSMRLPVGQVEGTSTVWNKPFGGERTVRVELDWQVIAQEAQGTLQSITLRRAGPQVSFGRTCGGEPVTCSWFVTRCINGFNPCDAVYTWTSPPFLGKWARIFLEARFTNDGHVAFGEVGAPPIFEGDLPMYRDNDDPKAPTVLTIGVANLQGASPGVDMWFDGIVVTER